MAQSYRLQVKAVGDASDARRALKQLSRSASDMHASVRRSFLNVAKAASVGIGVGLVLAVRSGVSELMNMQAANAQTAAGLKSTGGVANVTAKHINNLANSILMKTGIDDQATQAAENQLLTFTQIRNEAGKGAKTFDVATMAVANWAAKMNNGAVPSSEMMSQKALMLGKALNDPVKGYTKLQKAGVVFSDAQIKAIKLFEKHGQMAKAQGVILKEFAKEYGGSAAALAKTIGGQLGILREGFAGFAASALAKVVPAVLLFAQSVGKAFGATGRFHVVIEGTHAALIALWVGVQNAATAFRDGYAQAAGTAAQNSRAVAVSLADVIARAGELAGRILPKLGMILGTVAGLMSKHTTAVKIAIAAYISWRIYTLALSQALIGLAAFAIKQVIRGIISLTAAGMANPFIAALTAVTLLTVGLVVLYKTNERFRNKVNEVTASLVRHKMAVIELANKLTMGLVGSTVAVVAGFVSLARHGNMSFSSVGAAARSMLQIVSTVMLALVRVFLSPFVAIAGALSHLPGAAGRAFGRMHDAIVVQLDGVQKKINGLSTSGAARQADNLTSAFGRTLTKVEALGNKIMNMPTAKGGGGATPAGGGGGTQRGGRTAGRIRGRINAAGVNTGSAFEDSSQTYLDFAHATANPTAAFLTQRITANRYTLDADVVKRNALQRHINSQQALVDAKVAALNSAIAAKRKADHNYRVAGKKTKAAMKAKQVAAGAKVTQARANLSAARQKLADLTGDYDGAASEALSLAAAIEGDNSDIAAMGADGLPGTADDPANQSTGTDPLTSLVGDGSGAAGASPDLQAQLDKANADLTAANANLSLSGAALAAFSSSGDIGYGGLNALGAAGSSTTVNINTLSGADPRVAAHLADAVATGMNAGIYAQKTYSGSVGIGA